MTIQETMHMPRIEDDKSDLNITNYFYKVPLVTVHKQ